MIDTSFKDKRNDFQQWFGTLEQRVAFNFQLFSAISFLLFSSSSSSSFFAHTRKRYDILKQKKKKKDLNEAIL